MNLASLADENVEKFGEYDRIVFEGVTRTNVDLHEESKRLAASLQSLGLGPDDKVVVMMMNCPEVLASYPAIWRAGMVVIPVLFLLEAHELAYILENSGAKAIITSPELHYKVAEAAKDAKALEHVIVTGDSGSIPEGTKSYAELVGGSDIVESPVARGDEDLAVILYTSGTTGNPKGVMQTHGNLLAASENSFNSATDKNSLGRPGLLVLPLAHSFGLGVSVGGYRYGGRAVLMKWFNPEEALRLIAEHRLVGMAGVPTMFVYMLAHPDADKYDTSSMERWLVGAAPMPQEQKEQFEKKFGGTMYVGYGLTEACPGIAVEREGMPRKPGSTGIAMEGVEVEIVDDDGKPVPRGEPGELIARGKNISPGYYGLEEATRETFRDGWLYTGDVAVLDDDGYVFIVERKKDLIIRGGLNVYPKDVEDVIYKHSSVQECAVVGKPDDKMGEEVVAYIVKKSGDETSADAIMAHCQEHLAKYKTPRFVEFLSAMPKTNIGKIQKKELRKMARGEG